MICYLRRENIQNNCSGNFFLFWEGNRVSYTNVVLHSDLQWLYVLIKLFTIGISWFNFLAREELDLIFFFNERNYCNLNLYDTSQLKWINNDLQILSDKVISKKQNATCADRFSTQFSILSRCSWTFDLICRCNLDTSVTSICLQVYDWNILEDDVSCEYWVKR